MFKSKEEKPNPAAQTRNTAQVVAALLQEFGDNAFDCKGRPAAVLKLQCEAWIAHILEGARSPEREDLEDGWLDWPGVRDFVATERYRELQYVSETLSDLRELVLTVIQNFTETVKAEQTSDATIRERLDDLRDTADTECANELKGAVLEIVGSLNEFLETKEAEQQTRLEVLGKQVAELETELTEVKHTAERDGLTQVYNRRSLDDHLAHVVEIGHSSGKSYCLLMLDIDHFKTLNDDHGHTFGDKVLKEIAQSLGTVFLRDNDFVARYGGEEFAIVAACKIEDARQLGERLLGTIRGLVHEVNGERVRVTASIGLASIVRADTAAKWIDRADRALYASKKMGRDRLTIGSA